MIRKSWCKNFADIVFPAINEERFSVRYSENHAARPNTPVNFIVGSLKELNSVQFGFNLRWIVKAGDNSSGQGV